MATFEEYQAYLDSISQPEEEIIQPLRGEDFAAKLDNAFYAVRPITKEMGIGAREQGGSYWDDIVQGWGEFKFEDLVKKPISGLATVTRAIGEEAQKIPHMQSPYSDLPPSEAHKEYEESSFLGRTAYNVGFPLAKAGAGMAGFLPEIANVIVNPREYMEGEAPVPGSTAPAYKRLDLLAEQAGGLWQMIRDLPTTMSAGGQQLITGSLPTEKELETWKSAASWLYPSPKGALDRLHESPEGPVFAAAIISGAYNKIANKASGSGKTPDVTRQDISKSLGMERTATKALIKIGEGLERAKKYAVNPTGNFWGMAPKVNQILLDAKRKAFEAIISEPETAGVRKYQFEGKPPPKIKLYNPLERLENRISAKTKEPLIGVEYYDNFMKRADSPRPHPAFEGIYKSSNEIAYRKGKYHAIGDLLAKHDINLYKINDVYNNHVATVEQAMILLREKGYAVGREAIIKELAKKLPPKSPIAKSAKEPWEMTRKEFVKFEVERLKPEPSNIPAPRRYGDRHENIITERIQEGKSVPASVLKDYPDLMRSQKATTKLPKEIDDVFRDAPHGIIEKIDVKRVVYVDDLFGEGGRYDPKSKTVIVERGENVRSVVAHEAAHNIIEKFTGKDKPFIGDFIKLIFKDRKPIVIERYLSHLKKAPNKNPVRGLGGYLNTIEELMGDYIGNYVLKSPNLPSDIRLLFDSYFKERIGKTKQKYIGGPVRDIAEFKGKMAENMLEIKQSPMWIKKQMAAARKGYRDWREDINFRDLWQTPARMIPEIFHPVERVYNIMLDELSISLDMWNKAGAQIANSKNKNLKGAKIGQFLDAHSTKDINRLINRFGGGKTLPKEFSLSWPELQFAALTRSLTDILFSRSGAPEGKYRSSYITWLRDEMMRGDDGKLDITNVPRELAEQLPKNVYVRFLEHREGAVPPEVLNVFNIIPTYTQAMLKKIYLEPLFEQLKPTFDKLPPNKKSYANHWVNKIRGKPSGSIDLFARGIERVVGMRQGRVDKASRDIAALYYHSMLGIALDSGLKNLTQLGLTLAKSDTRSFALGFYQFLRKGTAEPKQQKLINEFFNIFESDRLVQSYVDKLGNINMTPFQTIELINRGVTYFVAKQLFYGRGMKEGMAHNQATAIAQKYARKFAKEFNRETQFTYGKMGTSPYLQNPLYRIFGQFTSFPLKYAETLMDWGKHDKRAIMRYMALAGAMTMIGDKYGFDVSEIWGTKAIPSGSQVIGGLSPLGTSIVNIGKAAHAYSQGKKYEAWGKAKEELYKPLPAQRFIRKLSKAYQNTKRGDLRTKHFNFIKKTDWKEQIRYVLGLRSLEIKELYDNQNENRKRSASFDDARLYYLDRIKEAELKGESPLDTAPEEGSPEFLIWLDAFNSNWKLNMEITAETKRLIYERKPEKRIYMNRRQ